MTPLRIRARLRSALTILRGVSPDEAAEVRAAYRVAYDCGDDEPIADLMRQAVSDAAYWTRAWERRGKELDVMERELTALRGVGSGGSAATQALNAIAAACGCAEWEYPGQVVRDVEAVVRERDTLRGERDEAEVERGQAVALISTLRAELAAAVEERDRLRAALTSLLDTVEAHAFDDGTGSVPEAVTAAHAAIDGTATPKRKRTKEERVATDRDRLATWWSMPSATALRGVMRQLGPATSREIATAMWPGGAPDPVDITNDMRIVSDLARAGYLTVAKGPGGVRVYGLKETPE